MVMNARIALFSLAAALMAGCATDTPATPRIKYPVTYTVQVGNTRVNSDYGPQNLSTTANQQVAVDPGSPLYYRVNAPYDVSVQVSEIPSTGSKRQVSTMQGMSFSATVTPTTPTLEFAFSPVRANTGGPLEFTLSDKPIGP